MILKTFPIHVRTITGLEEVLASELTALGAQNVKVENRAVICSGGLETIYKINLHSRTAIRVLKLISTQHASDEKGFYQAVKRIDWSPWIGPNGTLAVDANVYSSFTTHSLYLAQLTKDAIADQIRETTGNRPSVDLENPTLRIAVNLFQDTVHVFLDSSGESLHKRGYRKKSGEAPLSETLAAGMVKLSEWDGKSPLLNPMCGSGTLCIEAGLIARNIAPGLLRDRYAFQSWSDYDGSLFQRLKSEARNQIKKDVTVSILGFDHDPLVIEIARENIERASLSDLIQLKTIDFFDFEPGEPGTVLMNPPYDERLPVDNVADLYQRIGDRLKASYGGWNAFILCGNLEAVKYVGLRSSRKIPVFNGPIECRILKYEMRKSETATAKPAWRAANPLDNPKWKERAEVFKNRLTKNFKHESKWADREKITCWRVYDWDIPELPFILDLYEGHLHFAEIERNQDHSPVEHKSYIQLMVSTASEALGIEPKKVYYKKRKPQKAGSFQYTPVDTAREFVEVHEGGHRFLVNLKDYIDVGLFLDHRRTRGMVEKEAGGKDFLNLFAYTGSFSVYAACGGAKSTTTVDTNPTYLEWAENNLKLNGFLGKEHSIVRMDTLEFLSRTKMTYDLCVVDPPTRSVNRSSGREFEVQRDHVELLHLVIRRMRKGGRVYFSTNFRSFQLDEMGLKDGFNIEIKEITKQTVPRDFERKPSHRAWLISILDQK